MASRIIPRAEWRAFFDGIADALVGQAGGSRGGVARSGRLDVTEWVLLLGVTYDTRDDLLDVALSGLNHLIRRPRDIYVQEGPKGVETVAVVSPDGVKQILHLRDPLMLPAGQRHER